MLIIKKGRQGCNHSMEIVDDNGEIFGDCRNCELEIMYDESKKEQHMDIQKLLRQYGYDWQ